MLHTVKFTEAEYAVIGKTAAYFHLLKGASGTRVKITKNGSEVLESEVWQGMSFGGFDFDQVEFYSKFGQEIIVWLGLVPFNFNPQTDRQKSIRADQKFISNGIQTLLDYDPNRLTARIECDKDIWIGGDNMDVILGTPQNARKYKAGQEFEVTAYGDVKCFIADDAQAVLFENDGSVSNVAVPWEYGANRTRTELENLGVPYFDIEIPARMAGIPFKLNVLLQVDAGVTDQTPKLFITQGDPTTEALDDTGFISGGTSEGTYEYEGNQHLQWPNGLGVGFHRVFMVEESTTNGLVKGDVAGTRFVKVWTENNVFALAGTCQVMEERA